VEDWKCIAVHQESITAEKASAYAILESLFKENSELFVFSICCWTAIKYLTAFNFSFKEKNVS
jgi:hypothetical protein